MTQIEVDIMSKLRAIETSAVDTALKAADTRLRDRQYRFDGARLLLAGFAAGGVFMTAMVGVLHLFGP